MDYLIGKVENKRLVFIAAFVVGFSAIITQILVLREALAGFYANELIFGVLLGNWLLLTGFGSWIGAKSTWIKDEIKVLVFSQLLIALIAPLSVLLIKAGRTLAVAPGEILGPQTILALSIMTLAPFCVVSGFQFSLLASIASVNVKEPIDRASRVYIADSIGDLSGGLLYSFFLIFLFHSFQTVYILVFLNLVIGSVIAYKEGRKRLFWIPFSLILISLFFFSTNDFRDYSSRNLYPGQELVTQRSSLYGSIDVTRRADQLNFYVNSIPYYSTGNNFTNEEKIHLALLQHNNPQKVLLVFGGVSGTTYEILKYPGLEKVDYVELDPEIVNLGREHTDALNDPRIQVIIQDGRRYIKNTEERYDVVIVDLPDPESIQLNRFYTLEFFNEVKEVLEGGGVLSLHISGSENYLTEEQRRMNSALYNTLQQVFDNVLVVPGDTYYYVSSDIPLNYNYEEKLEDKGIETEYLQNYLQGIISKDRVGYAIQELNSAEAPINRDFTPTSNLLYIKHWLSIFGEWMFFKYLLIVLGVVASYVLLRRNAIEQTVFFVGFSGLTLEVVLLLGFQSLYGYVYHTLSLIITGFMAGLFLGANFSRVSLIGGGSSRKNLKTLVSILALYSSLLLIIFHFSSVILETNFTSAFAPYLFMLFNVVAGALIGAIFPIALGESVKSLKGIMAKNLAGRLYALDLFGACIGAYLAGILFLPLLGVTGTLLLVVAVNFLILVKLVVR
ncbi:hypothetical protein ACFLRC_03105 [Candidatus Altiarchaeota archaeon]